MFPLRKTEPFKAVNASLIDLPAPVNISAWWNFGFLLGAILFLQIATGLFLAMHYTPHVDLAFRSVAHLSRDVNYGWLLRNLHANGARWFFICIYLHVGRGIYYGSFLYHKVWNIGVILIVATIAAAFVGYVLPWGQIRFWGATVITNLLSAIPYVGPSIVEWLWGGFAVDNATLNRFFAFHFLIPFIILAFTLLHIMLLHQTGSNNPLGINRNRSKVPFHSYFRVKDSLALILIIFSLAFVSLFAPVLLGDPENFIPANPLVTPAHIKPEWYFLWAYAILRSVPNKLGGVVTMFAAILILLTLPFSSLQKGRGNQFYPLNQAFFWSFGAVCLLLTWIGGCPVEAPYELIGQVLTLAYFAFFFFNPLVAWMWDLALESLPFAVLEK